ncbi:RNA polymerase sigma factor [Piscinibacter sp. XHJ-5]|uniref:RNA polymerase sigma factor n=1 Tax=Piscinibacter sp. XHJ-5 TaxID=3037797 RepID=UPI0024530CC8|nr:RNA polymerase sigma factor [Piscinibacter sp. XHJ-5]
MMPFVPWKPAVRTDDASLARRVAAGDRDALALAYARESAGVYRYALALCGNAAWAADATQDAFIALASRAATFDAARGSLGAWLAGVARHTLLAQWRASQGRTGTDDSVDDVAAGEAEASIDTLLVHRQELEALWAAIRSLPWPFREALVLVDLQERRYDEAAAIAGVEVNTLRSRLHRARARLAAQLNAAAGEAA